MASIIKVDKLDPQSGTALEIGTSGDTVTVPSGVGLTLTNSTLLLPTTINTDKLDPKSGTALEIGSSGDTITIPSGATIINSGTATGFGGGKIGQVLSTELNTYFTTTSGTFVDVTGVDQTITPSAATSKIFVTITGTIGKDNGGNFHLQIMRDVTAIYTTVWDSEHPNTNYDYMFALSFLDEPSLDVAIDYQLQTKADAGTTAINSRAGSPANRGITNITCWEVLA